MPLLRNTHCKLYCSLSKLKLCPQCSSLHFKTELGPPSNCRDNVAMFVGQQIVACHLVTLSQCTLWQLLFNAKGFTLFLCSCHRNPNTMSQCRVVVCREATKLSRAQLCFKTSIKELSTQFLTKSNTRYNHQLYTL